MMSSTHWVKKYAFTLLTIVLLNTPIAYASSPPAPVEFIDIDYLKPSSNQNSHADYFPVSGAPIANEKIKMVATLSGSIKDVSFEFRTPAGAVIGKAPLTLLGMSDSPPFDFGGDVVIPNQPFILAASGNTQSGQNFNVTFPTPVVPEKFRVLFTPRIISLEPGGKLPVKLLIENSGTADTFEISFNDPSKILGSIYPKSLKIDAGVTQSIPLDIVASQNPKAQLDVYVTAHSNPTKKLTAELTLENY